MKLSSDLVLDARLTSELGERSMPGTWILGTARALEALMRADDLLTRPYATAR